MRISSQLWVTSIAAVAIAAPAAVASIQHDVVPGDYANTQGTAGFLGPLTVGPRTYQMLMHEDLLTDLVGRDLTGINFRLPVAATTPWPGSPATFDTYNVFLSGSVAPADRSNVFTENIVGQQSQVRSGSLTIPGSSFPGGGQPNDFGHEIGFDSGWTYTGGHLLLEIRHSGNDVGSRSVDALGTSTPGYGEMYSALWQSGMEPVTGTQGNFAIVQFTSVPAPGALALLGLAGLCTARRRRV